MILIESNIVKWATTATLQIMTKYKIANQFQTMQVHRLQASIVMKTPIAKLSALLLPARIRFVKG